MYIPQKHRNDVFLPQKFKITYLTVETLHKKIYQSNTDLTHIFLKNKASQN